MLIQYQIKLGETSV